MGQFRWVLIYKTFVYHVACMYGYMSNQHVCNYGTSLSLASNLIWAFILDNSFMEAVYA